MKYAILSDFDGTITLKDTAYIVLNKFVKPGWEEIDQKYETGEISLSEVLESLYSRINTPKHEVLNTIDKIVKIRPNFDRLIQYCSTNDIPFIIVSAGIDFIIEHILSKKQNWENIPYHAVTTDFTSTGLEVTVPKLTYKHSIDFKDDLIQQYKDKGYFVYFIGDGSSDFGAVRNANLSFVVKGSSLEQFCQQKKLKHISFDNFSEVVDHLKKNRAKRT